MPVVLGVPIVVSVRASGGTSACTSGGTSSCVSISVLID